MKRSNVLSLSLSLSLLTAAFLTGCSSDLSEETDTPLIEETTESVVVETEEKYPFSEMNYDGKSFRVYTSSNAATGTMKSSNFLIQGPDESSGDSASDAAFERNYYVEDLLNINLEFTPTDTAYASVQNLIRKYTMAGADEYDLIVNDIYGLAPLTIEGMFYSAENGEYFDFSKSYWYSDFMEDVAFREGDTFMMAGDFLIDSLRTAHCLVYNKDLYTNLYGDGDELYDLVLNGAWTMDKMIELVESSYADLDGNGEKNMGDTLGFGAFQDWGPFIPFSISLDVQYVGRDESGYPTLTMNNERTILLCDKIYELWHSQGTGALSIFDNSQEDVLKQFSAGNILIISYIQLGSLESDRLRDSEQEIGIIPYPKLDDQQETYVTSVHDTTEIGVIPTTMPESNLSFVSAVLEVLTRESNNTVLPVYYESALKIMYTRDMKSAQMIDLIHDGIGNSFALAWHQPLDSFLQNLIHASAQLENSFTSKYNKVEGKLTSLLTDMIDKYKENNEQ